jgi:hypothetical protein
MDRRPLYLAFAASFLVLGGAIGFLWLAWDFTILKDSDFAEVFLGSGLPQHERFILNEVGFLILMITGKFMLEGANWSRFVYIGWIVPWLGFCFYNDSDLELFEPSLLFHGTVILLLFLPGANRYFTSEFKWP